MLLIHDGESEAVELDTLADEGMRSYYNVYASISYACSDLYNEEPTCQTVTSASNVARQANELFEGKHCDTMCPSGDSKLSAPAPESLGAKVWQVWQNMHAS